MENTKRLLLALILSAAVIFFYTVFYERFFPSKEAPGKETPEKIAAEKGLEEEKGEEKVLGGKKEVIQKKPFKEEITEVETPLYRAIFTNHGGGLKSFQLKNYRETLDKTSAPVELVKPSGEVMLQTRISKDSSTEIIPFHLKESKTKISVSQNSKEKLSMTYNTPAGLTIEKNYLFNGDNYNIETEITVVNAQKQPLKGAVLTGLSSVIIKEKEKKKKDAYHSGPIRKVKEKVIRQKAEASEESGKEGLEWIGLEDKYFLSALVPAKGSNPGWRSAVTAENSVSASVGFPIELKPGEKALLKYNAFIGPKEYNLLKANGSGLEETIEFGFFSFIAKPCLSILNFSARYIRNYGLAIIVLTVIIKVLFYPLTKHSTTSMKEMQKIQPQMAAVKEKYKNDKEKVNKEMMELYKRHKINPVSGCLPMVLQIPVFLGLYEVLGVAIELRHAPFALWIIDLSAKDPYYVSPLVMGVTMFVQQKMTPSTMDPAQAKMMLVMPVVFTFLFMNFPSGLVLYWLTNNILSIIQQYQILRKAA